VLVEGERLEAKFMFNDNIMLGIGIGEMLK